MPSLFTTGRLRRWWQRAGAVGLAAVLVVALALAGCWAKPAQPAAGAGQAAAPAAAPAFPLTVTDDAGREVTIAAEPARLLAFAPSNTEILFALGLGSRVVGTDDFSDYPEEAKALPKAGGIVNPNFEKIVELDPDLVLTIGGTDEFVAELERLGIPVVVIQPQTFDDVLDRIDLIGRVTGAREAAGKLTAELRGRVQAVTGALAGLAEDERPKVFVEIWYDPLFTAGPGAFIHDLIGLAGGVNIAADAGEAWPQYSPEDVVAKNPDAIVTFFQETVDQIKAGQRPGWDRIAAVENGRILVIDQNILSRPGPRLVEGLETLARFLHPDRIR